LAPHLVHEGDVILGLSSSGIHSNGYSLVRKVAIEGKTVEELERPLPELGGESLADAVMRPTTIYAGGLVARAQGRRAHPRYGAHHRRRHHREPQPRAARKR
jgi:phosphoribosylaminoimidazole (AIR) synthetase